MRSTLIITAAACAILAGCNSSESDDAMGNTAAASNQVLPITDEDAAVANAATPALPAQAAPRDQAAALTKARHDNFEKIGDAMKVISRELKGDSPDLAAVRQNAGSVANLAPQLPSWFAPGTGPDVGKTHAKAEIWQKPEDFVAKSTAFTAAARAFNTAAQGTDLAAIRAAQGTLGKSCKACHDLYREKE
jgi:cytochrome c556